MTILAAPAPTPEQTPFLSSLGDSPAPKLAVTSQRFRALTSAEKILYLTSEAEWQTWVLEAAGTHGWTWWHDNDARKNRAGLPDAILLRERLVWAELKTETGKLRPGQALFAAALRKAGQQVHLWRPRHKAAVLEVLR